MKFADFLFTECLDPAQDRAMLDETREEALTAEELGMDAVFLAEHHFDGNCVYVDPISFAATIAAQTKRVRIGFAVIQTSLHHPVRLAEQIALLDNLTRGRMILGLGRGTMFNPYEYEGYQVAEEETAARLEETEDILLAAWAGGPVDHQGKFWKLKFPELRPPVFTKPHPLLLRSVSNAPEGLAKQAKKGRPFLLGTLGPDLLTQRMTLVRATMREAGYDSAAIDKVIGESWCWRNVCIAETDERATELAMDAHRRMVEYRSSVSPAFRAFIDRVSRPGIPDGMLVGTPASVLKQFERLAETGIGGAIIRFRIGMLGHAHVMNSLKLFATEVAPHLRAA